jgi:hypothetical protein
VDAEEQGRPVNADGRRRVAFVIPHPYVDALACFRAPIEWLADHGWEVHLYTTLSPQHPAPFFGRDSVRLRPMIVSRRGVVDLLRSLATERPKYRAIVSVPQWGLFYCAKAAKLTGVPLGCISDELKSDAEAATPEERRWRLRERRAHQQCAWTVALSEERAAFIRRENQLPADHPVFVVPNAAPGPARRLTSTYFRDSLGLPDGMRILLHAGSLWWPAAKEVAVAANGWPDRWTVVFQTRLAMSSNGWHDAAHVRFAREVLPASLLDYAVSSASIGLALYDERSANNRLMGTASGKIALYLKNDLPVIATRAGGLEWIEREGCGACVADVAEIPAAADRIWAQYAETTANVRAFYDRALDFNVRFKPVAEFMAAL